MLVAGIYVIGWLVVRGVKADVAQAANLVDPTSEGNIINQGIEHVGTALTGEQGWTLGGWLYDVTHDTAQYTAPTPLLSPAPDGSHGVYPSPGGA